MSPHTVPARNLAIAEQLRQAANLLKLQGASPFRSAAYGKAADFLATLETDIAEVAGRGPEALEALPHVGPRLAAAILEMVRTGRWSQLERIKGTLDPETLFQTIPGIGPSLAHKLHDGLHAETLEALEVAAHDGRLAALPGVGKRRAEAIRHALAAMLSRRRPIPLEASAEPPVSILLDADREYRDKAAAGSLQVIAPKRFNPDGKAWLPILHTERGPWHFTVLFSNTARAHELHKTADWVVIFYASDHRHEGQCTVVTETSGPQRGHRVVRGREDECAELSSAGSD